MAPASSSVISEVKQKLALAYRCNLAMNLKAEVLEVNDHVNTILESSKPERWKTTWWKQVTILLRRGVEEKRHEFFSPLKIGQLLLGTSHLQMGSPKAEKSQTEKEALESMYKLLGGGPRAEIHALWMEYGENSTPKAKVVKDFDK
ncbi:ABC transporter G family member 9-like protein, partial [Tanacetum coccineum]